MNVDSNQGASALGVSTRCIHSGTLNDIAVGGVNSPIYNSTAFTYPAASGANVYQRYFNTPNQQAVADKVAALEGGEAGLVFGSGMAAISAIFLSQLKPGGHAVFMADIYGGTYALIQDLLKRLEISVSWATSVESIAVQLTPKTRLIYIESPSNPLVRCIDIVAVADLAQQHGILSVIDNTFATPINQTPLTLGVDVVLHSATKYLNGHSDLNAGVVVGRADFIEQVRKCAVNLGGMLDAEVCARLERGLKTLALRMRQHNENGLLLAQALEAHDGVSRVCYPGLQSSPDHELAKRQMTGFGGMLAVELADSSRADAVLKRLRIIRPALSLGGVESLICVPAKTSHCSLTTEERAAIGISDGLLRVSVGVEDSEDLIADFEQALADSSCGL